MYGGWLEHGGELSSIEAEVRIDRALRPPTGACFFLVRRNSNHQTEIELLLKERWGREE